MSTASTASPREPLSIGELAARSGRSVRALRWYEARGLMPGVVRDAGRRRVYSPRHLEWLELLDRLQRYAARERGAARAPGLDSRLSPRGPAPRSRA